MKFWLRGLVAVLLLIGGFILLVDFSENRPRNLFTKYVSETTPQSVVVHHGESRIAGAVIFLEFSIDRNDLDPIIKSHYFSRAKFGGPTQPPSWFTPDESWEYWKADGGRQEMWYSTTNRVALYTQVNG